MVLGYGGFFRPDGRFFLDLPAGEIFGGFDAKNLLEIVFSTVFRSKKAQNFPPAAG